jgi:hypothetical protein
MALLFGGGIMKSVWIATLSRIVFVEDPACKRFWRVLWTCCSFGRASPCCCDRTFSSHSGVQIIEQLDRLNKGASGGRGSY